MEETMDKKKNKTIKEVLFAIMMGIAFLLVLIILSYILFPIQAEQGLISETLIIIGIPMFIAYITYYARKILEKLK